MFKTPKILLWLDLRSKGRNKLIRRSAFCFSYLINYRIHSFSFDLKHISIKFHYSTISFWTPFSLRNLSSFITLQSVFGLLLAWEILLRNLVLQPVLIFSLHFSVDFLLHFFKLQFVLIAYLLFLKMVLIDQQFQGTFWNSREWVKADLSTILISEPFPCRSSSKLEQ